MTAAPICPPNDKKIEVSAIGIFPWEFLSFLSRTKESTKKAKIWGYFHVLQLLILTTYRLQGKVIQNHDAAFLDSHNCQYL